MKATLITTVLPLVAGTMLAAAATGPFVERQVVGENVRLVATPPPGITTYLVKEKPPFGELGNISHGGVYDPATRTLVFGPFEDGQGRTLTYADYPPPGTEGRFAFSGEAVADGVSSPIVGDDYLEIPPFPPLGVRLLLRWRPLSQQIAIQLLGQEPCFVFASTDLQGWAPVGTISPVFTGSELVDTAAPNHQYRFYRAQTIVPPAQPLGDWAYQAFDAQGSLIVTGVVTFATAANPITGSWDFKPARTPLLSAHYVGQETFDEGEVTGQQVRVRKLRAIDNEFMLIGQMGGDDYMGVWEWGGEGPTERGTFIARRIPIPPPPQPLGEWVYQAFDAAGSLIVTGVVTFATSTSPINGTWEFQAVQTPPTTAHAVGQGSFTDAVIEGSQVTVPVRRIIDDFFTLIGDMGGDDYIGRWYWDGEGPSESGSFTAKRKP